jgi:hypothetical protein
MGERLQVLGECSGHWDDIHPISRDCMPTDWSPLREGCKRCDQPQASTAAILLLLEHSAVLWFCSGNHPLAFADNSREINVCHMCILRYCSANMTLFLYGKVQAFHAGVRTGPVLACAGKVPIDDALRGLYRLPCEVAFQCDSFRVHFACDEITGTMASTCSLKDHCTSLTTTVIKRIEMCMRDARRWSACRMFTRASDPCRIRASAISIDNLDQTGSVWRAVEFLFFFRPLGWSPV